MHNGRSVGYGKLAEMGVPVSEIDPMLMAWVLVGAEGEGEGGGSSGSGKGSQSGNQGGGDGGANSGSGEAGEGSEGGSDDSGGDGGGEGGDGSGDGEGDKDTFDRAYVEKLRRESADYRTRAKKAEEELNEKKKAEMSDLEKAQTERDEFKTKTETLESQLDSMRLQMAVTAEATAQNFYDPQDALSLIDRDEISKNDEGVYNKQSVEAAVKRLADAKPHLVKGKNAGAGSGDGGARGQGGGNMTEAEKQKQLEEEYKKRGGVPVPKL